MPVVHQMKCLRRNEDAMENYSWYFRFTTLTTRIFATIVFYFFSQHIFAQTNTADKFVQQFSSYQSLHCSEKIFVHADKTFYLAGESLWFKIYCVNAFSNAPSSLSKIGYVEIFNSENKPVLRAKIELEDGTGAGSFMLPSYLSSGNYTIVAYTNWMKDFDAQFYFRQQITIVNTLKPTSYTEATEKIGLDVQFFPEGGNLVGGIRSSVAVKAVDAHGDAVNCSGTIVDKEKNVVAAFDASKFGMGTFNFTPALNEVYEAVVQFNDTVFKFSLPAVYKNGTVVRLENINDAQLQLFVQTNAENNNAAYLLVHSKNNAEDFQQKDFSNGATTFTIDKTKLADGINVFTVFNTARQPVCERLYFKRPQSKLVITQRSDQALYATRKPVTISFDAAENAEMSMSVFMIDSLQSEQYNDIFSYLVLSSELKGTIENAAYYLQDNKDAAEAADLLMLTQGWRRFKWEDVLQDSKPYFSFLPEHEGFIVSGKITSKFSGSPAANITGYLTAPAENFQLAIANSNANGIVNFNLHKFYNSGNVIVKTDSNYKIEITPAYLDSFYSSASSFKMHQEWSSQLLARSINMQADNAYLADEKQRAYIYNNNDTTQFYGKPDYQYYLDDYTRFITMEEVMREYVTPVHVRKETNNFYFRNYNLSDKTFFNDNPLVLIDGMPVFNTNQVIQFDPLKVKRLDVIAHKYYYGKFVTNGIVSYTTYKGDLADFPLTEGEVVVEFDGLQREREFYSPSYATEQQQQSRIPDFRNVLYWAPHITTNTAGKVQVKFYSSDITGKFACVVQGITKNGLAGSSIITFDVVK